MVAAVDVNRVLTIAFSPRDPFLVSGVLDGKLQLWDVKTGDVVDGGELLPGLKWLEAIMSVSFSADGTRLVSAASIGTIRVFDMDTRLTVGVFNAGNTVLGVAYSPDGTQIACSKHEGYVSRWDPITNNMIGKSERAHLKPVRSIMFSPDSRRIVTASDDTTIKLWNARTEGREQIENPITVHTDLIHAAKWSPDGEYIASGSADRTVRVWNIREKKEVVKPLKGHSHSITCVAFSPDGAWIASGSLDKTMRLWDAKTGKMVGEPLIVHTDAISDVAFSSSGEMFASSSWDGTIQLWPVVARRSNTQSGAPQPLSSPHNILDRRDTLDSFPPDSAHPPNLPPLETLRLKDGWILGPNDELILWLPLGLRNVVPFVPKDVIPRIDFGDFAYGTEWTQYWDGEVDDG